MSINARIGESLLASLVTLREQKGNPSIEDIGIMFQQMAHSMNLQAGSPDMALFGEIQKLAAIIDNAKMEMASIGSSNSGDAIEQLEAVIKSTEEAGHNILNAAEAIQAAANGQPNEQKISELVMKIYEACNFQDLAGQRLTKVIKLLAEIDRNIHAMLTLFGAQGTKGGGAKAKKSPAADGSHLLNGPQIVAPSQGQIDALFDSLSPEKPVSGKH